MQTTNNSSTWYQKTMERPSKGIKNIFAIYSFYFLEDEFLENYRNPNKMCALGMTQFRLQNATLSGSIYTYTLELVPHSNYSSVSRSQFLPIYGNICAKFLVQPISLNQALAKGTLDIFFLERGVLFQKMYCILQGAQLKCYNNFSIQNNLNEFGSIRTALEKTISVLNLRIDRVRFFLNSV